MREQAELNTVTNGSKEIANKVLNRNQRRKAGRINNKLFSILHIFYSSLGKKQLSPSEVKDVYAECNSMWKSVCRKNNLHKSAYSIFEQEVSATLQKKIDKAKKEEEVCE